MKNKFNIEYVVTLTATLFALSLIVYFTFGSFYSIAKEDAVTMGENAVAQEAEQVNNFLIKGLDVMQVTGLVLDYMMEQNKSCEEMEQFLLEESAKYEKNIGANFTGIYGVFDGVYLDGSGWVPEEDYVPEERPWYTTALDGGGKPVIVSPYLDAKTNTIMISVCELLSDGKSVVSLDIVMEEVQDMARTINLSGVGYGLVFDDDGLVVAHSDESQKGKNYLTEEFFGKEEEELVHKVYASNNKAFEMEIDGEMNMVFSQSVQNDWHVVMIVNETDLFKKVKNNLYRNILLSLLIFALMAYFCTSSAKNRHKALLLVDELKEYQTDLEGKVEEKTRENEAQNLKMMAMQQNVIDGMATLIESRDGNTGQHVRNVKNYVIMMVEYMKSHGIHPEEIDDTFVKNVSSAAVLHDIGKIKISDTVLNKPGQFTPEEFEIMKTHSLIGGEIVADILGEETDRELLQISKDITTYHHEKWDGSGYPSGLAGEEIPLSARIMAVADVFDALVSKRVYKDKFPLETAYDILRKEKGAHFDPEIVDVFFAVHEQVEEYMASLPQQ